MRKEHPIGHERVAVAVDPNALLRLPQVLQIVPVGASTWWAGVKSGRFPKPVKLGPRTTCWRATDILKLTAGNHES
jgi:prophage regulatory protein